MSLPPTLTARARAFAVIGAGAAAAGMPEPALVPAGAGASLEILAERALLIRAHVVGVMKPAPRVSSAATPAFAQSLSAFPQLL